MAHILDLRGVWDCYKMVTIIEIAVLLPGYHKQVIFFGPKFCNLYSANQPKALLNYPK
jgi:hypothetical protein